MNKCLNILFFSFLFCACTSTQEQDLKLSVVKSPSTTSTNAFYVSNKQPLLPLLSHGSGPDRVFPWFGNVLPLWIVLVIFGRELFITLFRSYAARRGVVIAAGPSGKYKAFSQNIFIGGAILWLALQSAARHHGWTDRGFWAGWQIFHRGFCVVLLSIAVVLTVYSMLVYLWNYRALVLETGRAP